MFGGVVGARAVYEGAEGGVVVFVWGCIWHRGVWRETKRSGAMISRRATVGALVTS